MNFAQNEYVRCWFCDIRTQPPVHKETDHNNIFWSCPACGHGNMSRLFTVDEHDEARLKADIKQHHALEDTQQQLIKDLQEELKTNAALLAKQHDRNMELETEIKRLINYLGCETITVAGCLCNVCNRDIVDNLRLLKQALSGEGGK